MSGKDERAAFYWFIPIAHAYVACKVQAAYKCDLDIFIPLADEFLTMLQAVLLQFVS